MTTTAEETPRWWARGLLFESCNCQIVCPGHVHFDQMCTHERCIGYWAIRFDQGQYGGVSLNDVRAVVAFDSPRHMIDGDWTEIIFIDERATSEQRRSVETILKGEAGGPWSVLARFVSRRLDTRVMPIQFDDEETKKRVVIDGVIDATVEAIRGRDPSKPVQFENIFNQIHASSQVIAMGSTCYNDGTIVVDTEKTHGLWSSFDWLVKPP